MTSLSKPLLTSFILSSLLGYFALVGGPSVRAAEEPSSTPGPQSASLKVAPTKYEATIEPGQPQDGTIDIVNVGELPLQVTTGVENARMIGEQGSLEFYIGDNPFRLHNFVQVDTTPFQLGPGEGRTVKFRVTIPVGTFPGGYFGAVFFQINSVPSGDGAATIAQSGRVGTLLLFTVAGAVDQRGELRSLQATRPLLGDRTQFVASYANTGSTTQKPLGVAYQPAGELRLKNMLGITTRRQAVQGETVFPGAQRQLSTELRKPLWFGRYTAELSLSPGAGQPATTRSVSFWAISPLAVGLVGVLMLSVLGIAQRRKRQRHSTVSVH